MNEKLLQFLDDEGALTSFLFNTAKGFIWIDTEEGREYWSDLNKKWSNPLLVSAGVFWGSTYVKEMD